MINLNSFSQVLQLLVVVSSDWNTTKGVLCRYQRDPAALQWKLAAAPIEVSLGKNGMAWGRGLRDFTDEKGLVKKEGDNRSPAGIFYLGPAFGDELHQSCAQKMPFLLIDDELECVDDPNSYYYNRFVHTKNNPVRD
jgi:D-alanyl-D-alanine dipeptidase